MNAPWWRITTDKQSTEGTLSATKDSDDDLLPPFVD
jgi:hypothetical protein